MEFHELCIAMTISFLQSYTIMEVFLWSPAVSLIFLFKIKYKSIKVKLMKECNFFFCLHGFYTFIPAQLSL